MTAYVHHIETLVPQYAHEQGCIAEKLGKWTDDRQTARVLRHLARQSGISRRYSVLPDFHDGAEPTLFRLDEAEALMEPGTQERNRIFMLECRKLGVEVALNAIGAARDILPGPVTHVITVSCTGFYSPGLDMEIVEALGLSSGTERYHLGFMGCYAAVPALRMANDICRAKPHACVLIVSVELCTLHMRNGKEPDTLLANTIFADGAAAAIVSAIKPQGGSPSLAIGRFNSAIAPRTSGEMAWEIGDRGFRMALSSYVPEIIGLNVGNIVTQLLAEDECLREDVDCWAIHPGGKSILDQVEKALELRPDHIAASRAVLNDFGNMSSATVLFVLERILRDMDVVPRAVYGMAFGPGLTIESFTATALPACTDAANSYSVATGELGQ